MQASASFCVCARVSHSAFIELIMNVRVIERYFNISDIIIITFARHNAYGTGHDWKRYSPATVTTAIAEERKNEYFPPRRWLAELCGHLLIHVLVLNLRAHFSSADNISAVFF